MNGTLFNYLFQSQLWSIVTSGGSAFHNINITCSVTKTFSATNCLWYDTITDIMLLLLLRNHSDAFRHRKCLISLAPPCDYSWHGTTPGPQRSWAESAPGPWHWCSGSPCWNTWRRQAARPVSRARSSRLLSAQLRCGPGVVAVWRQRYETFTVPKCVAMVTE